MKKIKLFILGLLLLFLIVSCGIKKPVLYITGRVKKTYTQRNLNNMETVKSEFTDKNEETQIFTGVPLLYLLEDAGVEEFDKIVITAADDYSAKISSEDLEQCTGCILAYSEENGWHSVMPGFSGKLQVKNVVELKVK